MRKARKPTSPTQNTSPRRLRSSTKTAANSTPPEAFQKSSQTSQELIDRPRKTQKRKYAAEDEHSQERLRKDLPSASLFTAASQDLVDVWQTRGKNRSYDSEDSHSNKRRRGFVPESQLSEENLKKLERDLKKPEKRTPDEMDPGVTVSNRVLKRLPSQQASVSDLTQETASLSSKKPSVSNSVYRFLILDQAHIYIRPEPPPIEIQAQMDVIFKREIPEKRRKEISDIAKNISQKFIYKLRGAHREDDLVELVYLALLMMQKDEGTFEISRKAGIVLSLTSIYTSLRAHLDLDWNPSLKPDIQQGLFNLETLGQPKTEANDVVDSPNKRQQKGQFFPFPDASRSTMPPPAAPSKPIQDAVKTPRPDFTIGLCHSTISNALIERGLSEPMADDFLKELQREWNLCSDPTQNYLNVRFPILVIEGKSYATGTTVFEAQNQAAVSGSCMINLEQQLTDLFEGVFSNLKGRKTHLAFSICTEGPQIEFWVHYALLNSNVRRHYMNIFRTCYGSLQGGLEDFLVDVDLLMRWIKDEFLKEVADQLYQLANHAARG